MDNMSNDNRLPDNTLYIPPSLLFKINNPPHNGTWILEFESPGLGDTIDLLPLIHSLIFKETRWNILIRTNHFEIPFHLTNSRVRTQNISDPSNSLPSSSVLINLTETLKHPIYCPPWLRYFIASGQTRIFAYDEPFPILRLNSRDILVKHNCSVNNRYILHHRYNTRVDFEGRNTDPSNHEYIAKRFENEGYTVLEIGNDCPPSCNRPYLGNLSFEELFIIVKDAVGFFGIDSFPMHVAALYRKPILGFFGSTHPYSVLPHFGPIVHVRHEELSCLNCQAFNKPYELNKCIWGNQICGSPLSKSYLEGKVEEFLKILVTYQPGTGFFDSNILSSFVQIGKSEYELQKALELAVEHLPEISPITNKLKSICSPANFIKNRLLVQQMFV